MIDTWNMTTNAQPGTIRHLNGKLWIPVKGFEAHLEQELVLQQPRGLKHIGTTGTASHLQGEPRRDASAKLIYCEDIRQEIYWKQLCWESPFIVHFDSIGEAAERLRSIQRNWAHYPLACFRRAALISEKLPYISTKEKNFPYTVPLADMGVWSLLDEHTLLASAKTSSPFPLGLIRFAEDHQNPPSRAYLKLWEALTLLGFYVRRTCATDTVPAGTVPENVPPAAQPFGTIQQTEPIQAAVPAAPHSSTIQQPMQTSNPLIPIIQQGTRCIDAGACPGGWTWALNQFSAQITAIDRSPLADELMRKPNITFMQHDAFTLSPESLGKQDWVFSDVICYPPRLFEWVERWRKSGLCSQFVCTIKMQGEPDFETIHRFARIPHSKIVHLTANKHELTWLCAPFIEE